MTKQEALIALNNGEKLTYENFYSFEWVKKKDNDNYVFEDGVVCPIAEFWIHRTDPRWETGWSIFKD